MADIKSVNLVSVESSNLDKVGYDDFTNDLYVQFKSSGLYVYYNVPKEVYNELLSAESKGKYHNKNIKWKYEYKRLS